MCYDVFGVLDVPGFWVLWCFPLTERRRFLIMFDLHVPGVLIFGFSVFLKLSNFLDFGFRCIWFLGPDLFCVLCN